MVTIYYRSAFKESFFNLLKYYVVMGDYGWSMNFDTSLSDYG